MPASSKAVDPAAPGPAQLLAVLKGRQCKHRRGPPPMAPPRSYTLCVALLNIANPAPLAPQSRHAAASTALLIEA